MYVSVREPAVGAGAGGGECYGETRRVRAPVWGSEEDDVVAKCTRVVVHRRPFL
jgi:hypothetical protein